MSVCDSSVVALSGVWGDARLKRIEYGRPGVRKYKAKLRPI